MTDDELRAILDPAKRRAGFEAWKASLVRPENPWVSAQAFEGEMCSSVAEHDRSFLKSTKRGGKSEALRRGEAIHRELERQLRERGGLASDKERWRLMVERLYAPREWRMTWDDLDPASGT